MDYLVQFRNYLLKECHVLNRNEKFYFVLLSGLFSFLFLLFFQPFGVNNYNPEETINTEFALALLAMSIVISLFFALIEFILMPILKRYWGTFPIGAWALLTIILLTTGVFLFYNILGNWHDFNIKSYFEFLGNVGALALAPMLGLLVYARLKDLRIALATNHHYQHKPIDGGVLIVFTAENQKDKFTLPLKLLLFIEADDNYVSIYYLLQDKPTKTLFRLSLKSIQEANLHPSLVRCHRSYIINLMQIQNIQGNRNKLLVFLKYVDKAIPVSRQYIDSILSLISS